MILEFDRSKDQQEKCTDIKEQRITDVYYLLLLTKRDDVIIQEAILSFQLVRQQSA